MFVGPLDCVGTSNVIVANTVQILLCSKKMSREKMWRKPKERLRYTNEHSLMLLKEVLDRNPFEDPYRWSTVHENFVRMTARPHTLRSVREHVDYLLKLYVKGDLEK